MRTPDDTTAPAAPISPVGQAAGRWWNFDRLSPSGPGARLSALCPWVCWLVMTCLAISLVGRYGTNMPFWDEFWYVPYFTQEETVTLDWLWHPHNEHRIPLSKVIQIGLVRVTHGDFRGGMWYTVLLTSLLAALLILAARRVRGHSNFADAAFPLLLLHGAHAENFLWSFQVAFSTSTFLLGVILILLTQRDSLTPDNAIPDHRRLLGIGVSALMLPLLGAQGLLVVLALATWLLIVCGCSLRKSAVSSWRLLLLATLALAAYALVFLYTRGGATNSHLPTDQTALQDIVREAAQFLAVGFGSGVTPVYWLVCGVILLLIGVVIGVVYWAWHSRPEVRLSALGVALFLAAMLGTTVAIGRARVGYGLSQRYALLSLPLLLALYLTALRWGGRITARWVPATIFFIAVLFLVPNQRCGRELAKHRRANFRQLQALMATNHSTAEITEACGEKFFPDKDRFRRYFEIMQGTGVGPFREEKIESPRAPNSSE